MPVHPDPHPAPGRPAGVRGRIVPPAPPAPVPKPRQRSPLVSTARTRLDGSILGSRRAAGDPEVSPPTNKASDGDVARSTGSMAVATLLSRITGFLRNVFLIATIGPAIGSAFLTANTLPNLITEVVLGAVLTSLVVPVLVRAEKEDPDRGAAFIRRLMTLSLTLLGVVTVLSVLAAPLLAQLPLKHDGDVNVVQATSFAYLLLPQILFYGVFALFMAILNTKGVFKPGAWAPVANNVVVLVVLALYWFLPGGLAPADPAGVTNPHILLLGVGTTLGVVIQAVIMVPYLKKAGIDLRPLWGIDERLKQFGGMAAAIVVYVAISQLGYIIATRIASAADDRAPTIYQQAWLLLQVPYGIIGVTLLTAIMPRLSRNAADGDHKAVVHDLTLAMKLTLMSLIPVIGFMTAFGGQIAHALFAYGKFTGEDATILGWTLSFSAFGLIPYAMVLLHLRVFYAREEAWTPTLIIAGITGTKVLLSLAAPLVATSRASVVVVLGTANGCGFIAGAVIGVLLLRRKLGNLGGREITRTCAWTAGASLIGGAVVVACDMGVVWLTGGDPSHFGSLGYFVRTAFFGVVFLVVVGLVLSRSGLEEVAAVAGLAARLPGVGKFVSTKRADSAASLAPPTPQEFNQQLLISEPFDASPVPPPMSAGVVRGPRLVPGAPVCDGRFRLLADHGCVAGARFWQALEKSSGQQVALVFVDTTGAPDQATAAAQAAAVTSATWALNDVDSPAIARVRDITTYRSGCVVVADWVEGTPLATVAEDGADPRAACWALHDLADAAAKAHERGLVVGLGNRTRLRITPEGVAVNAFPAVLADNTAAEDIYSIGAALQVLCRTAEQVPPKIVSLISQCLAFNGLAFNATTPDNEDAAGSPPRTVTSDPDSAITGITAGEVALQLVDQSFAGSIEPADTDREKIVISADTTPKPTEAAGGFGQASYSSKAVAAIVALSIALVLLAAGLAIYVAGLFNQGKPDNPIKPVNPIAKMTNPDDGDNANPLSVPVPIGITGAFEWQPAPVPPGFEDNPDIAHLAADNDPGTWWQTDVYRDQFAPPPQGTKPGIGIVVDLAQPATITSVAVTSPTPGTGVTLFGVPTAIPMGQFDALGQAQVLGRADLHDGTTTVPVDNPGVYNRVVVWVDRLPDSRQAKLAEIAITGHPAP